MGTRYRLQDGSAFFVTTTALNFEPIFLNPELFDIGLKSLNFCRDKYDVHVAAFVFMPNHWHGLLWKENGFDLSGFMRDFKRFTSVEIRRGLINIDKAKPFQKRIPPLGRPKYQIWKNRFDVVAVQSEDVLITKINYIHNNPVRKGLVAKPEEWPFASAGFYFCGRDVGIPIVWIGGS